MLDSQIDQPAPTATTAPETRFSTRNLVFAVATIATLGLALVVLAVVVGLAYHRVVHNTLGPVDRHMAGGLLIAICYVVPFMVRGEYTVDAYLRGMHRARRTFVAWNMAFLTFAFVAFLTKTTAGYSRGAFLTFYIVGLMALTLIETRIRAFVMMGLRSGRIQPRRTMLVGARSDLAAFQERLQTIVSETERLSMRIVAVTVVPDEIFAHETPRSSQISLWDDVLKDASKRARALLPDEVVVLGSWRFGEHLERCIDAFMLMPTAISIDGGPMLGRFSDVKVRRIGGAATVSLTEPPLKPLDVAMKRTFDILGSGLGLILLSPVFLIISVLIRRDSPGSAIFRQDRLGFNQRRFRIYKFRSMTATENGSTITQAVTNDHRVTRIGAVLRRTNLDELPQLINVFRGEMSLVGPRPHAIAHDLDYEQRILSYPRRLNVKPGITGWAQVNGLRGETDTDEKMRQRVNYDLYYVDNWSLLFDIQIILLTIFSPLAYRNAK